eukprot:TRINITY_DN36510_c0_g1_i1.p1 TRINITY_DN36510_c0_g1~~TRINITY_DN36510_c0_g1_i1.p1  ORF type:complete len:182 (-),score=19.05 TRINITY_DN36510_c0_g1_i1:19-564(-)
MVKTRYAGKPENESKTSKALASDIRVHFKNTRECAQAISGMSVKRAFAFLDNVLEHKEIVPFRRFMGGLGRHAQVKHHKKATQGRWPKKSVLHLRDLLKNAYANAAHPQRQQKLDQDKLYISHIQVDRAPTGRRRVYRAHGRINAYLSHPSHIEIILSEKETPVPKGSTKAQKKETAQIEG